MPTPPDPAARPILLHVFPTFAVGGAQTRFTAIANHFGDRFHHDIVALDGRFEAREKLLPGLHVSFHHVPPRPGPAGTLRAARAYLRRTQASLLITSNWGAMDWAAMRPAGLPHLHTEDGFGPDEQDRQRSRRVLARRLLLRRSQLVLPSRTLLRIASNIWRLPAERLLYIPNGIDTARFAGAQAATLPPGQGTVIGTIAALRPEKNIARLLRAFALLRRQMPARLVIVGDGREHTALQALAQSLGIAAHVLFAGHSTTPEQWLAAFDLFALPSDTEQMPLSLLEAMAAGLPVVSTDVGDVRTMLAPENAAWIVPRDEAAFAAALADLASDAPRARTIGNANRLCAVQHFDEAKMLARWAPLLVPRADQAKSA